MCIHFGAVKVVHSKSSDKHESSLTLRVALNKSWHRLIAWQIGITRFNTAYFSTMIGLSLGAVWGTPMLACLSKQVMFGVHTP